MRVGSFCTGIGGAEMALDMIGLNPELQWYCEIDKDAAGVCATRFPGVPNLGDLTAVDWSTAPSVDLVVGGYPCQGESLAGLRKGADDERWIWPGIAEALRVLRPRIALFENVAAHLSGTFWRVLCDLAALGFDVRWSTVRASDIGFCHQRDRLFIAATDPSCPGVGPIPAVSLRDEAPDAGGGQAHNDVTFGDGQARGTDGRMEQ